MMCTTWFIRVQKKTFLCSYISKNYIFASVFAPISHKIILQMKTYKSSVFLECLYYYQNCGQSSTFWVVQNCLGPYLDNKICNPYSHVVNKLHNSFVSFIEGVGPLSRPACCTCLKIYSAFSVLYFSSHLRIA